MSKPQAYEEIVEFIASGADPASVIAFKPSPEARARVADLLAREKAGTLTAEEKAELDRFAHLEHLMRLAKAHARHLLRAQ